ncbi:unnamed protein product [Trichobilharzia szidati]|nr:unnamed protein product [Trichobilharzia szidati]
MCIKIEIYECDSGNALQSLSNRIIPTMEDGNYLTSPLGLFFTLCTLLGSGGAKSNTGLQIAKALHIQSCQLVQDDTSLEGCAVQATLLYSSVLNSLTKEVTEIDADKRKVITVAHGIFIRENSQVGEEFQRQLMDSFHQRVYKVNFADQNSTMKSINEWVENKTNGLIPQFFNTPEEVIPNSFLSLFSVFHFKDVWEVPFMNDFTELATFEVSLQRQIQVNLMSNEEELDYGDFTSEGFQMISKSLKNTRFTFIAILPKIKWNIQSISGFLNGSMSLEQYIKKLENNMVSLKLPRFSLESTSNLIEVLKSIGVTDLFSPDKADLSGITGERNIYVTNFQQKNIIRVDEIGIAAGSVANMVMIPLSAARNPIEFHATHPFICFVYDRQLKISLFTAYVAEPSE